MTRNPDHVGYSRDLSGSIPPQRLDREANIRRALAAIYLRRFGAEDLAELLGVGELYAAAGDPA